MPTIARLQDTPCELLALRASMSTDCWRDAAGQRFVGEGRDFPLAGWSIPFWAGSRVPLQDPLQHRLLLAVPKRGFACPGRAGPSGRARPGAAQTPPPPSQLAPTEHCVMVVLGSDRQRPKGWGAG